MYLLDTNVVSELRRADRADACVLAWSRAQPIGAQFVSIVTLMELEIGVLRAERRDPAQGAPLRAWLQHQVQSSFEGRALAVDQRVALRCARLHVPDPAPERDALIAATALVHGMTLVTRNVRDFDGTGVRLINPWEPT